MPALNASNVRVGHLLFEAEVIGAQSCSAPPCWDGVTMEPSQLQQLRRQVPTSGANLGEVRRRCELDPFLKAVRFQNLILERVNIAFKFEPFCFLKLAPLQRGR